MLCTHVQVGQHDTGALYMLQQGTKMQDTEVSALWQNHSTSKDGKSILLNLLNPIE